MQIRYSVVVAWSNEDDCYIAVCPELGGISAFGETYEKAIEEIQVAMSLSIEEFEAMGRDLPVPKHVDSFKEEIASMRKQVDELEKLMTDMESRLDALLQ